MLRLNVGCGQTPITGWKNYDNSLSIRLSKIPFLPQFLLKLGLLESSQYEFIRFARDNDLEYADATKGLPIPNESCEVLYSSHMIEHLDRNEVDVFLKEAFRVLCPGGIIRIVVPDMKKLIQQYHESDDCDAFIEATHLWCNSPKSIAKRLRLLIVGTRHHKWMYDGNSLIRLLQRHGFVRAEIMPAGLTRIQAYEPLDLHERASESVYVEAEKPIVY